MGHARRRRRFVAMNSRVSQSVPTCTCVVPRRGRRPQGSSGPATYPGPGGHGRVAAHLRTAVAAAPRLSWTPSKPDFLFEKPRIGVLQNSCCWAGGVRAALRRPWWARRGVGEAVGERPDVGQHVGNASRPKSEVLLVAHHRHVQAGAVEDGPTGVVGHELGAGRVQREGGPGTFEMVTLNTGRCRPAIRIVECQPGGGRAAPAP